MNKKILVIIIILLVLAFIGGVAYIILSTKTPSIQKPVAEENRQINITPEISPQARKIEVTTGIRNSPTPSVAKLTPNAVPLTILSPEKGASLKTAKVTVKGKTSPNSEVYANEAEETADAKGNFSLTLSLDEGENIIIVSVIDPDGNSSEQELTVNYSP